MATDGKALDHVINVYSRQGWYPAKWAHHPQPIKDAIRDVGFRPQMKQCFANCQRLMISRHPIVDELEYREGYVISLIPMAHAWLIWRGQRVDLTLMPDRDDVQYLESHGYNVEEVVRGIFFNGCFAPIDERRLYELDPMRRAWKRLEVRDGT